MIGAPSFAASLFLSIAGAIIGGLAPYIGIFALLGTVVGMFCCAGPYSSGEEAEFVARRVMAISVGLSSFVGIVWTIFRARTSTKVNAKRV
jgi:hypothetical protein